MDIVYGLMETYSQFFSMEVLVRELSNPANWGIILSLIILEGLLSADNALVLAAMVKHLDEKQQKKALLYGIWGAYIFRFIAIGLGVYLVKFQAVKIFGGLYLLYLSFSFFRDLIKNRGQEEDEVQIKTGWAYRLFGQFWGTIFLVEMMDIAFSIDSVLAAFAVSNQVWVLFIGGLIGVLMMRGIAGVFLKLLDKIPELEAGAFLVIAFVGLKMTLSAFGIYLHPNETIEQIIFFISLFVILGGTVAYHYIKKNKLA